MSKLLIDEKPIQVLPKLAEKIGLNEAIVLQQLHYWINNPKNRGHKQDGYKWVYNTYEQWQEDNFPFWSTRTIQRIFLKLESLGLVVSEQLDKQDYNHQKFYRIDYEELAKLEPKKPDDSDKMALSEDTKGHNLNKNTEITSEITKDSSSSPSRVQQAMKDAEKDTTSKDYVKGLRERHPSIAMGLPVAPKSPLDNILEYPPEVQHVIKEFCNKWHIFPPPKGTSLYGKWIKDAKEVKTLINNTGLSIEVAMAEAYYDWKTPHEFSKTDRGHFEGKFTVTSLGSLTNYVWERCSAILDGRAKRKTETYTDQNGNRIEYDV